MSADENSKSTFVIPEIYLPSNWSDGFGHQVGPIYETRPDVRPFRRAFLVSKKHVNGRGDCHGGMLMAFADMALGHAITTRHHRYWVTVRLMTDFVRAAKIGDWVEGSGMIIGEEDGFTTVRGQVWTGDELLMSASGVFKALGRRPVREID